MAFAFALAGAVVVGACHGGKDATAPEGSGHASTNGRCQPSSVVTTSSCAKGSLPAVNATSARGCKSDADCKNGLEGRCIESGYHDARAAAGTRANLLAEPPAAPAPTVCTYDQCDANTVCGPKARCACGSGTDARERNTCVAIDHCLVDADCGEAELCDCGEGGRANTCIESNCRDDADCNGTTCLKGPSGAYCATANDTCKKHEDCAANAAERLCDYDRTRKTWGCRSVPPVPAG